MVSLYPALAPIARARCTGEPLTRRIRAELPVAVTLGAVAAAFTLAAWTGLK